MSQNMKGCGTGQTEHESALQHEEMHGASSALLLALQHQTQTQRQVLTNTGSGYDLTYPHSF